MRSVGCLVAAEAALGFAGEAAFLTGSAAFGATAFLAGAAVFLAVAFFTGLAAGPGSACFFVAIMGGGLDFDRMGTPSAEWNPRHGFPGLPADFIRV